MSAAVLTGPGQDANRDFWTAPLPKLEFRRPEPSVDIRSRLIDQLSNTGISPLSITGDSWQTNLQRVAGAAALIRATEYRAAHDDETVRAVLDIASTALLNDLSIFGISVVKGATTIEMLSDLSCACREEGAGYSDARKTSLAEWSHYAELVLARTNRHAPPPKAAA